LPCISAVLVSTLLFFSNWIRSPEAAMQDTVLRLHMATALVFYLLL
jgi:hypothetical protein